MITLIKQVSPKRIVKKVPRRRKIEELEEIKALSENDRELVVKEYKKRYHFLLFYGQFFVIFLMVMVFEYVDSFVKMLFWGYRIFIYAVLGYSISILCNFIELNIIAKKVVGDLIKDIRGAR
ncbi:MAG: hypothetical protein GY702_07065 [Desulfobulbaceae bacterium]|nr:hypothetical protein [Desulfobulbaceae bacterium]